MKGLHQIKITITITIYIYIYTYTFIQFSIMYTPIIPIKPRQLSFIVSCIVNIQFYPSAYLTLIFSLSIPYLLLIS